MFGSVSKESGGYSTVEMGQDSTVKGVGTVLRTMSGWYRASGAPCCVRTELNIY